MSIVRKFRCDVCSKEAESTGRAPVGWHILGWRPGLLSNTERKPDKHFCSIDCRDKHKATMGADDE